MSVKSAFGWHVDGFVDGRLRGWVSIGRSASYVRATLDGRVVADGLADRFRPDLEIAGRARSGACAFDLALTTQDVDGKLLEMFLGGSAGIPFAAMVLPAGTPVLLPRMSLVLAYVLKPIIRPLLRALASSVPLRRPIPAYDSLPLPRVVDGVFEGILGRAPDRETHDFHAGGLRANSDVRTFVESLLRSPEFSVLSPQSATVRELAIIAEETLETLLESRGAKLGLPPIGAEGVPLADLVSSTSQLLSTIRMLAERAARC